MESTNENQTRKQNQNKWICPICKQEKNSSGAPGHLRNKHRINWRKMYLDFPESVFAKETIKTPVERAKRIKDLFYEYNYQNNDRANRAISRLSHFTNYTLKALDNEDNTALEIIDFLLGKAMREFVKYNDKNTQ